MSNNKTKMNHEFLLSEYEQMFTEKRHTDGRFMFLVSLYFTIITISVSVFAVVYNLDGVHFENAMSVFAYVFLLVAVLGMIIVAAMCFNRVNNVKAIRQINHIRKYYLDSLKKQCKKFVNGYVMESDSKKPRFHMLDSTQLIFMYSISILSSISMGMSLYLFMRAFPENLYIIMPIIVSVIILAMQVCLLLYKLRKKDKGKSHD
jgi:hypothetical protein